MGNNTIQAKTNEGATTMTNTRPRVAQLTQPTNNTDKDQFVESTQDENRVLNDKEMSQVVDGDNPSKKEASESTTANNEGLTPQQHRVVKGDSVWALLLSRGFSHQEIASFALAETAKLSKLKNPNVIRTGDILTFPERKTEQQTSNQANTSQAKTEQTSSNAADEAKKLVEGWLTKKGLKATDLQARPAKRGGFLVRATVAGKVRHLRVRNGQVSEMQPKTNASQTTSSKSTRGAGATQPSAQREIRFAKDAVRAAMRAESYVVEIFSLSAKVQKDGSVLVRAYRGPGDGAKSHTIDYRVVNGKATKIGEKVVEG